MFKNHPKGLLGAALSNMGERFGYYIMNAVLTLFLCSKFGLPPATGALIYSVFYAGIYVLSLVGGSIADKKSNYKGTIIVGLIIMSIGYGLLSIPIMSNSENINLLLFFTCFSLFLIAFGNGLFKGNLQAIVGQMYDNLEKDAKEKGEKALKEAKRRRDSGFQIFYVFINIGGLIAPFIAPLLRSWWLGKNYLLYNSDLPALCHKFLKFGESMVGVGANPEDIANGITQYQSLTTLATDVTQIGASVDPSNLTEFCNNYLGIFNTGIHYSFIASIVAMLISLVIFFVNKKTFPNPVKKIDNVVTYSAEEKSKMAKDIRQRMLALFAVLGVVIFFWFAFHQNGVSLSFFARDFIQTDKIAPEIWQSVNPFFVIVLTPLIMLIFASINKKREKKKKDEISTPLKIVIGMGIVALGYIFLTVISKINSYPSYDDYMKLGESAKLALKSTPLILIGMYFFLTVAELFISPLGLSFVSKIAPKDKLGLCQGLWLTATAIGNSILFVGGILYENIPLWTCWLVFVVACALSMAVMLFMLKWLEKVTNDRNEIAK
ncbi:MAG: peptide MFS transporter [Prevotellaceae bacterium]|jgi:POT family proton-dependent oligopeptide transporter|nr:peptide MFS transporter [Prevotellaceae bacterium]